MVPCPNMKSHVLSYCPSTIFPYSIMFLFPITAIVQSLSHARLDTTPRTAALQAPLCSAVSWSLLEFISIESAMLSNLCCPFLLLPSIFSSPSPFQVVGSSPYMAKRIRASASASVLPMNIQG